MTDSNAERTKYWVIRDGALIKTAYLDTQSVKIVSNDAYLEDYTHLKDFFLQKATEANRTP